MTSPIRGSFEVEINTDKQADSIVDSLDEKERERLLDALNKKMGTKQEVTEKKELSYEPLLNKPNMTAKDKEGMQKSIKFLIDKDMDISEYFRRLEAINYGWNYIEIGGVKRARENMKVQPDYRNIFKHGDEVYFTFNALKNQTELLADQGMVIPSKANFITALKALPGNFLEREWYEGGNILGNILDLSKSGWCDSTSGGICLRGGVHIWSSTEGDGHDARSFRVLEGEGKLSRDNRIIALLARPILK